ncbi:hypothetical protein ACLMJK_001368 [Lecanora helva]
MPSDVAMGKRREGDETMTGPSSSVGGSQRPENPSRSKKSNTSFNEPEAKTKLSDPSKARELRKLLKLKHRTPEEREEKFRILCDFKSKLHPGEQDDDLDAHIAMLDQALRADAALDQQSGESDDESSPLTSFSGSPVPPPGGSSGGNFQRLTVEGQSDLEQRFTESGTTNASSTSQGHREHLPSSALAVPSTSNPTASGSGGAVGGQVERTTTLPDPEHSRRLRSGKITGSLHSDDGSANRSNATAHHTSSGTADEASGVRLGSSRGNTGDATTQIQHLSGPAVDPTPSNLQSGNDAPMQGSMSVFTPVAPTTSPITPLQRTQESRNITESAQYPTHINVHDQRSDIDSSLRHYRNRSSPPRGPVETLQSLDRDRSRSPVSRPQPNYPRLFSYSPLAGHENEVAASDSGDRMEIDDVMQNVQTLPANVPDVPVAQEQAQQSWTPDPMSIDGNSNGPDDLQNESHVDSRGQDRTQPISLSGSSRQHDDYDGLESREAGPLQTQNPIDNRDPLTRNENHPNLTYVIENTSDQHPASQDGAEQFDDDEVQPRHPATPNANIRAPYQDRDDSRIDTESDSEGSVTGPRGHNRHVLRDLQMEAKFWRPVGKGKQIVVQYGPVHAATYRIEPGSTTGCVWDVSDQSVQKISDQRRVRTNRRERSKIIWVAWMVKSKTIDPLEGLDPRKREKPGQGFAQTLVRLKWPDGTKSVELRQVFRETFTRTARHADEAIFEKARRQQNKYREWLHGQAQGQAGAGLPASVLENPARLAQALEQEAIRARVSPMLPGFFRQYGMPAEERIDRRQAAPRRMHERQFSSSEEDLYDRRPIVRRPPQYPLEPQVEPMPRRQPTRSTAHRPHSDDRNPRARHPGESLLESVTVPTQQRHRSSRRPQEPNAMPDLLPTASRRSRRRQDESNTDPPPDPSHRGQPSSPMQTRRSGQAANQRSSDNTRTDSNVNRMRDQRLADTELARHQRGDRNHVRTTERQGILPQAHDDERSPEL